MILVTTFIIAYLLHEVVSHRKLMKVFRNNRYYIFKYLAQNTTNQTLESYLNKSFFPKYAALLIGNLLSVSAACLVFPKISLYINLFSIAVVILVRLYNRQIFTDLYAELGRTQ